MRWLVITETNPSGEGLLADRMEVDEGCLVFRDKYGDEFVSHMAYAPGEWRVAFVEDN